MTDKRTESGAERESRLGLVPPARSGGRATPAAGGRSAARPRTSGSGAGPGSGSGGSRPARPRFRLTRRATILALALCAVVVTIAYPFQQYLSQNSQLDTINRQNARLAQQVGRLQQQVGLWSDPGYVASQARAQLHYVKPGEEGFTVPGPANGTEPLGLPTPTASPWYDTLWNTVKSPSAAPSGGR